MNLAKFFNKIVPTANSINSDQAVSSDTSSGPRLFMFRLYNNRLYIIIDTKFCLSIFDLKCLQSFFFNLFDTEDHNSVPMRTFIGTDRNLGWRFGNSKMH